MMPLPGHDRLMGQPLSASRGRSTSPSKKKLSTSICVHCKAPSKGEKTILSVNDKISMLLGYISGVLNWTLGDALAKILAAPDKDRSPEHAKVVEGLMDGRGTRFVDIVVSAYDRACEIGYRKNDVTRPEKLVNPGADPKKFAHAQPALIAWAIQLVTTFVQRESDEMAKPEAGNSMRAGPAKRKAGVKPRKRASDILGNTSVSSSATASGSTGRVDDAAIAADESMESTGNDLFDTAPGEDLYATWRRVAQFTFAKMEDTQHERAPLTTHLVRAYQDPHYTGEESASDAADRKYRPYHIAVTQQLASMTFSRARTNGSLFAMVRGIWMFATCAAQTLYRVDSRISLSVSYETVRTALVSMSAGALVGLRTGLLPGSGIDWFFNGDNIQAYMKQGAQRLGFVNRMIKGYAGCAIRMEDVKPGAMDLDKYLEKASRMERRTLTVEKLLADLDEDHLDRVAHFSFLSVLVNHVPALAIYAPDVSALNTKLKKHQINPERLTDIIPFKSNGADEMTPQGMKEAIVDHTQVQGGLTEETVGNRSSFIGGDGKTFGMMHTLKRYLADQAGTLASWRCFIPVLALWHTKWTNESSVIRASYGPTDGSDPSTLAAIAKQAELRPPKNLSQVDYFDGARLIELALDAYILDIWTNEFECDELKEHFAGLLAARELPVFEDLLERTKRLVERHATTNAFKRAYECPPSELHLQVPETSVDERPWEAGAGKHRNGTKNSPLDTLSSDDEDDGEGAEDALSEYSMEEESLPSAAKPDCTLANGILFIRNAIWWLEMCRAVAMGDTGRVWEILKVWIFTFAGSGNPNYTTYLLETYCNLVFEFPEDMRQALLENWLVNLKGLPGHFLEMDLMQEHCNFWLEHMAQHKGKEFDDAFYRDVVSANVLWFLRVKDEMEDAVSLQRRSKKHTEVKLQNELRATMDLLRKNKVNKRVPGRTWGHQAEDDFSKGLAALKSGKLDEFIARTTMYMDQKGDSNGATSSAANLDFELDGLTGLDGSIRGSPADLHGLAGSEPPSAHRVLHGEVCM